MDETIEALIELASIDLELRKRNVNHDGIEIRRAALRRLLPGLVLATYDALVRAGRNPAIVESRGAYCGGCNLRLPEKLAGQIRGEKNLFACPHCRRFVYFKSWSEGED
jgi:predicted  nucleic acid-binding Zn-ribbon protein